MKADKKAVGRLLKTARGQIDGILEMIENDRYCVDISNQLLATRSILTKANQIVLKAHLQGCVQDAFENGYAEAKIDEVIQLLEKMNR